MRQPTLCQTLAILHASGPLRVGYLASRARVALPTISRIVDEIVRRGWALRRVDQTDHRARTATSAADAEQPVAMARVAGAARVETERARGDAERMLAQFRAEAACEGDELRADVPGPRQAR